MKRKIENVVFLLSSRTGRLADVTSRGERACLLSLLPPQLCLPACRVATAGGRARRGRASSSRFVPLQSADNIAAVAVAADLAVVGPAFTSSDHPTPTVRRHATDARATIVSAVDDNVCCIDQKERRGGGPKLHLPFLFSYGGKAARIQSTELSPRVSPPFPATPSRILLRGAGK